MEKEKKLARERAVIILQVRSGALTATEGGGRLGTRGKKKQNEKGEGREEAIGKVMEIIEEMKGKTGMSYGMICQAMRVPLPTLGRWRRRRKENHPLLNRPAPKKLEPLDSSILVAEIRLLDHGPKRSGGATKLYGQYQGSLSRREVSRVVGPGR